jgi:hypothetical protein
MLAHASEQQEKTKFNIQRCSHEDDDLQVGDIFAKVKIVKVVLNICIGYSWTFIMQVCYVLESNFINRSNI